MSIQELEQKRQKTQERRTKSIALMWRKHRDMGDGHELRRLRGAKKRSDDALKALESSTSSSPSHLVALIQAKKACHTADTDLFTQLRIRRERENLVVTEEVLVRTYQKLDATIKQLKEEETILEAYTDPNGSTITLEQIRDAFRNTKILTPELQELVGISEFTHGAQTSPQVVPDEGSQPQEKLSRRVIEKKYRLADGALLAAQLTEHQHEILRMIPIALDDLVSRLNSTRTLTKAKIDRLSFSLYQTTRFASRHLDIRRIGDRIVFIDVATNKPLEYSALPVDPDDAADVPLENSTPTASPEYTTVRPYSLIETSSRGTRVQINHAHTMPDGSLKMFRLTYNQHVVLSLLLERPHTRSELKDTLGVADASLSTTLGALRWSLNDTFAKCGLEFLVSHEPRDIKYSLVVTNTISGAETQEKTMSINEPLQGIDIHESPMHSLEFTVGSYRFALNALTAEEKTMFACVIYLLNEQQRKGVRYIGAWDVMSRVLGSDFNERISNNATKIPDFLYVHVIQSINEKLRNQIGGMHLSVEGSILADKYISLRDESHVTLHPELVDTSAVPGVEIPAVGKSVQPSQNKTAEKSRMLDTRVFKVCGHTFSIGVGDRASHLLSLLPAGSQYLLNSLFEYDSTLKDMSAPEVQQCINGAIHEINRALNVSGAHLELVVEGGQYKIIPVNFSTIPDQHRVTSSAETKRHEDDFKPVYLPMLGLEELNQTEKFVFESTLKLVLLKDNAYTARLSRALRERLAEQDVSSYVHKTAVKVLREMGRTYSQQKINMVYELVQDYFEESTIL